jgi:hypothetical protein
MLGGNYVWMLNSHAGYYKRATAIGINMTVGNSAGLVIGQIFKNQTSEGRYLEGEATSLGVALMCALVIPCIYVYKRRKNNERNALTEDERQRWIDNGKTGDAHPDFRYIL